MATEVKIKIKAFPYYVESTDPVSGNDVKVERIARRGDVVELSDTDLERAKRFDAIVGKDDEIPPPGEQPPPEDSVEGLADWLRDEKPTVQEVVDRADGDPVLAQKLIDAENLATGQQPRSTLIEDLQQIVDGDGA